MSIVSAYYAHFFVDRNVRILWNYASV